MKFFRNKSFSWFFGSALLTVFFSGCFSSVSPEQLYGGWEYTKIESPRQDPPYVMPGDQLKEQSPSIAFSKDNDLRIRWGGKILSNGKFRLEDKIIRYKENLPGGKTREFPFLIKKLTETEIVFETMEQDFTRVTARKMR